MAALALWRGEGPGRRSLREDDTPRHEKISYDFVKLCHRRFFMGSSPKRDSERAISRESFERGSFCGPSYLLKTRARSPGTRDVRLYGQGETASSSVPLTGFLTRK